MIIGGWGGRWLEPLAAASRDTVAMAFKVWLADGDDLEDGGDDDVYEFLTGGVVAIHRGAPGEWSRYYPPAGWTRVAATPNHPPGGPVNRSTGPDFT